MKTKTLRQTVIFACSPHDFYEIILDSKKHSLCTGETAKIDRKVGGKFTAYGDYIEGKNLKLVKDKKIVQLWRGNDFPENHYSTVTFELKKDKAGTKLVFTQEGLPEDRIKDLAEGWKDFYWEKIHKKLAPKSTSKSKPKAKPKKKK